MLSLPWMPILLIGVWFQLLKYGQLMRAFKPRISLFALCSILGQADKKSGCFFGTSRRCKPQMPLNTPKHPHPIPPPIHNKNSHQSPFLTFSSHFWVAWDSQPTLPRDISYANKTFHISLVCLCIIKVYKPNLGWGSVFFSGGDGESLLMHKPPCFSQTTHYWLVRDPFFKTWGFFFVVVVAL